MWDEATADYEAFWARQARELVTWFEDFDTVLDWQERVRSAHAHKAPLRIRGGGSKDFYGGLLAGKADMLVSMGNTWAIRSRYVRAVQAGSATLLARLAGVPLIRAENRPGDSA